MTEKQSATPQLDAAWKAAKRRASEAYDARDALSMVEAETQADVIWKKRELANDLARLAHRLAWLADALEADPNYAPNACGEVQGSGLSIDVACAELARMRTILDGIATARRAAASPEGA
jgi:hypothetical protein